jgi:hypothetical protein
LDVIGSSAFDRLGINMLALSANATYVLFRPKSVAASANRCAFA